MKKINIEKIISVLKNGKRIFRISNIVYVLVLGLIARLVLANFGTLQLDQNTFIAWSNNLAENGFRPFYNSWSDYLPGYLYILWILGKINSLNLFSTIVLYKIPAIISDLITGFLIYKIVKNRKGEKLGLLGALIYIFNPAILYNSALWGQVDSFVALFSTLTIYLLPKNYLLSAITLAIGTVIKPQAAFLMPLIFVLFWKNKYKFTDLLKYCLVGLTIFVLAFIPFWNDNNLFNFILNRLSASANQYPYTAVNAFNFWGIFGQWKEDTVYTQFGGYLVFLISFVFFSKKLWNVKNFDYILASITFVFTFLFFTRFHERHLLPVFAPLAIISTLDLAFIVPYIALSLTYIANLRYAFVWLTEDRREIFGQGLINLIIAISIFSLFLIFYIAHRREKFLSILLSIKKFFDKGRREVKTLQYREIKIKPQITKVVLIAILIFAFATRVYKINLPEKDYFDEIYHAFTARIVLHNDPKAWEWWNPHPEGFAYEWTHPPLSKLVMAGSMKIFGENSFGWRIPQAVFGTLSILLVYLIAKHIFKDEIISLTSAFLFSLDGLFLVLSRMAMNDVYVLFFALASTLFFLEKRDVFSAISLGLAIASKWSAIWIIPVLFLLWLKRTKKFNGYIFLSFIIFPFGVYILTYLPMFLTGHDLGTWWGMQKQMWWYHTGLTATHPYSSMWWSWPFNLRPVYLYTSDEINGLVSRIYAIGNPFIFWFGFTSITLSIIYAFFEKNKNLAFVVFAYLIFFVPWVASPRVMFLYHYLPSIPFLCIATAYILRRFPKMTFSFLAFSFLAFVYFYPHWAGLQVPLWLDKSYYWIPSWR